MYKYIFTCVCIHVYIRAHTHTFTHDSHIELNSTWYVTHCFTNTHTHTHTHARTCKHICKHMFTFVLTNLFQTYKHVYVYKRTHATHTHKHKRDGTWGNRTNRGNQTNAKLTCVMLARLRACLHACVVCVCVPRDSRTQQAPVNKQPHSTLESSIQLRCS